MQKLRSPIKFKVLEAIDKRGGIETRELARVVGVGIPHASKLLRTYWAQGLLSRFSKPMDQGGIRYLYTLTLHGKGRLNYFRGGVKDGA